MILADTLAYLTTFTPKTLAKVLDTSGYKMCSFKTVKFLGMTNGGQFCYSVTYFDEAGTGQDEVGKVFVSYDHANNSITADF
jgi:hypothetical protein